MMMNRAGWLALSVLALATLLMVFFVLPRISENAEPVGQAINAAGEKVKDAVAEGVPQAGKPTEQAASSPAAQPTPSTSSAAPQPDPAQPTAPPETAAQPADKGTASLTTPSFDVLRVEPDGSTVIAGRAEPGSKLEISDGAAVVAKVDVGASGDFAVALDAPLPAGDHQLALKATARDGRSITSEETATVLVPDGDKGKLLAMVTKPGKASRLINVPAAETAQPASAPAQPPSVEATAASAAPAMPELPAAASDLVAAAPQVAATPESVAPQAEVAGAAAPVAPADVQVTAVEIEGDRIFIAGRAKPQASLRGYADDKPVGDAKAAQDGHFVIEGKVDLSVGDHTIGVESLGPAGQVIVRVAVPFNRPAGEQVAAVAQAEAPQAPAAAITPAATATGETKSGATGAREPAKTAAAETKTIEQAPLTQSQNSVIIRRGDTLWQISRRVYGQGVRYTTIYLANEEQIVNPDRIQPGQIFGVPDEALPNAEELHRKRLQKS